jgi:hypothetical protein
MRSFQQLFNQAHDFVMKDTTLIENINMGGDNCEDCRRCN